MATGASAKPENQHAEPAADSAPTREDCRQLANTRAISPGSRHSSHAPCSVVWIMLITTRHTSALSTTSSPGSAMLAALMKIEHTANAKPAAMPSSAPRCRVAASSAAGVTPRPAKESTSTPPTDTAMPSQESAGITSPSSSSAMNAAWMASVLE